jgi:hypothetical protein
MNSIWKFLQYGYLVVAVIFLVEGFIAWGQDRERAIFMFVFAIFISIIFFFKRNFRKKVQKRNQQK